MVADRFSFDPQPPPSLRDWYAGLALLGLWLNREQELGIGDAGVAERAFSIANAMMAEREATCAN